jgi:hypothetical protein
MDKHPLSEQRRREFMEFERQVSDCQRSSGKIFKTQKEALQEVQRYATARIEQVRKSR